MKTHCEEMGDRDGEWEDQGDATLVGFYFPGPG
jgi:hypothetical protein